MKKKVALFHTSLVFIEKERMLFDFLEELLPDVEIHNVIEDRMWEDLFENDGLTPQMTRRICLYAMGSAAMGVDVIFSTCSSVGPAMDVAKSFVDIPILKIDQAMADKAAEEGTKIGVLATGKTTLGPTVDLINESAKRLGKQVDARATLTKDGFDILMKGEIEKHDDLVAETAQEVSKWADTLVLAQCSMTRLVPRLTEETGLPVLSSPELGVHRLKQVLGL